MLDRNRLGQLFPHLDGYKNYLEHWLKCICLHLMPRDLVLVYLQRGIEMYIFNKLFG